MPNSCPECSLGGVYDPNVVILGYKIPWTALGSKVPKELNIQNGYVGTRTDGTGFCNLRDKKTKLCNMPVVVVQELFEQMVDKIEGPSPLTDSNLNNYFEETNRKLIKIFGPQFKPVPHDKNLVKPFRRAVLDQIEKFKAKCEIIVDPTKSIDPPLEEIENQA